jgi:hypothetical protein
MSCLDGEDNYFHHDILVTDTLSLSQKAMPAYSYPDVYERAQVHKCLKTGETYYPATTAFLLISILTSKTCLFSLCI